QVNTSEVLIQGRYHEQAQDAVRLEPKWYVVRCRGCRVPCRGWRTTGPWARPYPGAIEEMNEVTPLPPREGRLTAKEADEAAGKEGGTVWKVKRPRPRNWGPTVDRCGGRHWR